jgi:hypothetical protein
MLADRFARRSVNSPISAFRRRGSMNGFTELPRLPVERWLCRSCPWRRPAPGTFGRSPGGRAANRDVHPWFASDSPLEGGGFEPSVPHQRDSQAMSSSGSHETLRWRGESGANSSRAAGPTPPIKGRFHRRSDELLESIKKGVETPEKGRNAGEKLIPQGQAGGGGIKNQRINPAH